MIICNMYGRVLRNENILICERKKKNSQSRAFPPVLSITRIVKMLPGRFAAAVMKPSIYTVR